MCSYHNRMGLLLIALPDMSRPILRPNFLLGRGLSIKLRYVVGSAVCMHATIRNTFDANWLNRLVYYGVASRQFSSAIGKIGNLQWTPSSMVTSAKLQANTVLKILAKFCRTCRKVTFCHCFAVACNNTSQSKARVLLITFQHNNFKSYITIIQAVTGYIQT